MLHARGLFCHHYLVNLLSRDARARPWARASGVPLGLGGPLVRARVRAEVVGRARGEGARRSNELHFRSDWSSINALSAVTISRGILNDDRRT